MSDDRQKALNGPVRCFRDSLIGRNAKGIVHNMNSPLQVLSMQIELLGMELNQLASMECDNQEVVSGIAQAAKRLGQLEDIVSKINHLVKLVGSRVVDEDKQEEQAPVMINQLLEETLEFWKSDLFFKHKVFLSLILPDASPVVVTNEQHLKDALDCVLFVCIESQRKAAEPRIDVSVSMEEGSKVVMSFLSNGAGFLANSLSTSKSGTEDAKRLHPYSFTPFDLAMEVARASMERINGKLLLADDSIVLQIYAMS